MCFITGIANVATFDWTTKRKSSGNGAGHVRYGGKTEKEKAWGP
jgi:hypothetical protein